VIPIGRGYIRQVKDYGLLIAISLYHYLQYCAPRPALYGGNGSGDGRSEQEIWMLFIMK
jgi:hypothetical protein